MKESGFRLTEKNPFSHPGSGLMGPAQIYAPGPYPARKMRAPLIAYASGVNRPKPCNGDKEDGVGRIEKTDALDVLAERLSRKTEKFLGH